MSSSSLWVRANYKSPIGQDPSPESAHRGSGKEATPKPRGSARRIDLTLRSDDDKGKSFASDDDGHFNDDNDSSSDLSSEPDLKPSKKDR
jgi:hypothetical protein